MKLKNFVLIISLLLALCMFCACSVVALNGEVKTSEQSDAEEETFTKESKEESEDGSTEVPLDTNTDENDVTESEFAEQDFSDSEGLTDCEDVEIIPSEFEQYFTFFYLDAEDAYEIRALDESFQGTEIKIPSSYRGKKVVCIGENVFYARDGLVSVTIPSCIRKIGSYAFSRLDTLTTIVFEEESGLEFIGYAAFQDCSSLYNFKIPSSVTTISDHSFDGCRMLVQVENGVRYVDNWAIGCENDVSSILLREGTVGVSSCAFDLKLTTATTLTIPAGLKYICDSAFGYCWFSEDVVIPSSVVKIGSGAFSFALKGTANIKFENGIQLKEIERLTFYGCEFETFTLPSSVELIGDGAFLECRNLKSFSIHSNVRSIGENPFRGCDSLVELTVDINNSAYLGEGNCIVEKESKTLIAGCSETVIPTNGSVIKIGSYAFNNCCNLRRISIPDSVIWIGEFAFNVCQSLSNIEISGNSSLEKIEKGAFEGCILLDEINFPTTLTYIGDKAFLYTGVVNVKIPENVYKIGESAFELCVCLESIVLEGNSQLSSLGENAFLDCSALRTVNFGNCKALLKISTSAFEGCTSLSNISLPKGISSIGERAFFENTSLRVLDFSDFHSLNSIGESVFEGCTSLEECVLSSYITDIGARAFYNCESLITIDIPGRVTSIKDSTFRNCTSLETIMFPECLMNIKEDAFLDCVSLREIVLPEGVTSIGSRGFFGCTGLTSIVLPDAIVSIEDLAFRRCTSLVSVTCGSNLRQLGERAFYDCTSLEHIIIPAGITDVGDDVFYNCESLKDVYYCGDEENWMDEDFKNDFLPEFTTIYYYSELEPTKTGYYWHYVDGVPVSWV